MIAVEVGDADPGDLVRGDAGEQHLPLRALARVEQQPLVVPAQEVPVVIARAGGCLTCGTEDDQLTVGHGPTLAAPRPVTARRRGEPRSRPAAGSAGPRAPRPTLRSSPTEPPPGRSARPVRSARGTAARRPAAAGAEPGRAPIRGFAGRTAVRRRPGSR